MNERTNTTGLSASINASINEVTKQNLDEMLARQSNRFHLREPVTTITGKQYVVSTVDLDPCGVWGLVGDRYETMVFDASEPGFIRCYATQDDAMCGHRQVVVDLLIMGYNEFFGFRSQCKYPNGCGVDDDDD